MEEGGWRRKGGRKEGTEVWRQGGGGRSAEIGGECERRREVSRKREWRDYVCEEQGENN